MLYKERRELFVLSFSFKNLCFQKHGSKLCGTLSTDKKPEDKKYDDD